MEGVDLIGLLAGILTTSAVAPQVKKAWTTKKVEDVSYAMFGILLTGVALWVVYGVMKNDWPIILTNGVSLGLNMVMLYLMVKYKERDAEKGECH